MDKLLNTYGVKLNSVISKDVKPFLDLCFNEKGEKEHYKVGCINAVDSASYIEEKRPGFDNYYINVNEFTDALKKIKVCSNQDIYITKNTFKGNILSDTAIAKIKELNLKTTVDVPESKICHRTEENLFALTNIVIDIDNHDGLSPEEMLEFKENFLSAWEDIKAEIPTPTGLYFSGRGFHIYYHLERTSSKLIWLYRSIARTLCERIAEAIRNNLPVSYEEYNIDKAASINPAGFIRFPGTKNTRSKIDEDLCDFEKTIYNLNDLKDALSLSYVAKVKKNLRKRFATKGDTKALYKKRLHIIEESVLRHGRNIGEGCRHNYLLAYYLCEKGLVGPEKALKNLISFNNRVFSKPVSLREIESMIRCVNRKGTYKYKNQSFAELLGLTDEEITEFGLNKINSESDRNRRRRSSTAEKKAKRDKKVLNIFASTGSYREVARQTNLSENTIRKIVRDNSDLLEKIKIRRRNVRNRRLFNSYINSGNLEKAAKAGKCCKATAKSVINKYSNLRESLKMCIERDPVIHSEVDDFLKILDRQGYLTTNKIINAVHRNGKFLGNEARRFVEKVSEYYSIDKDEVAIAFCPYLRLN